MSMSEGTSGGAGDAFDILIQGHRRISNLFTQIENTTAAQVEQRTDLLQQLKHEILQHAIAEEDVVYPALREQAQLQSEAKELFSEHAEVKTFLYKLAEMPKDSPLWVQTATDFRNAMVEHIVDEEQNVFPQYRAMLTGDQLAHLTELVKQEQAQLRP